jgi:hypothetical protein
MDPVSKFRFPETTERPGYSVGFADNVGDALTFKSLKNDLVIVLHRSVVRSAANANHRNRRVSFKSDVQESLKLLDNKPIFFRKIVIISINLESGPKEDYTDQDIGSRTGSKMQIVNVNNLRVQNLFFPLHDEILFQGY